MVCGQFHSKVRDLTGKWEVGEGEAIVTDHSGGKLGEYIQPVVSTHGSIPRVTCVIILLCVIDGSSNEGSL